MKFFKFSFLLLLLSLLALPLSAENNGLNNKFVKNNAEAVMFLPQFSSYGIAGIHLNISANDFSIFAAKDDGSTVFNLSAQKSFMSVSKDEYNGVYSYYFICKGHNIAKKDWFGIEISFLDGSDYVTVTVYRDYKRNVNGMIDFKTTDSYMCDAMAFHSGGYYGLQNPKYDTNIKKSFKFFETFIKANFKKIEKQQDYPFF